MVIIHLFILFIFIEYLVHVRLQTSYWEDGEIENSPHIQGAF